MKTTIRNQALKTVHDYNTLDDFEAAMIEFGRTLPIVYPNSKDPHHFYMCRGAARWVWERRDTVYPPGQPA